MNTRPCHFLLRLLLLVSALCWAIVAGSAQTANPFPEPAKTSAEVPVQSEASAKSKDAKLTPPPGKMRGMTNEMRKAAAIRNADRKAHAQIKTNSSAQQGEVKQ